MKDMDANDVIDIYKLLEDNGILITIDGGWSIDALIGKQTRKHNDLDIALEHKDVPKLREILFLKGYKNVERSNSKDFNFILVNDKWHEVDIHILARDRWG